MKDPKSIERNFKKVFVLFGIFMVLTAIALVIDSEEDIARQVIIPLMFAGLGGFFLWFIWFWKRSNRKEHRKSVERLQPFSGRSGMGTEKDFEIKLRGLYLIGVIFLLIGGFLIYKMTGIVLNSTDILIYIPLLLGMGLVVLSYSEFYVITISISRGEVHYRKKYLLNQIQWHEPLVSYLGFTKTQMIIKVTGAGQKPRYMGNYILLHPDLIKSGIKIGEADESEAATTEKQLIEWLGLPLLLPGEEDEGFVKLPQDEGKTVRQLLEEKRIKRNRLSELPFDGHRLRVKTSGSGELAVTQSMTGSLWLGLSVVVVGVTAGYFSGEPAVLIPCLIIGLFLMAFSLKRERLNIYPDHISRLSFYGIRLLKTAELPLSGLTEVRISQDPIRHRVPCLLLAAGVESTYFGQGAGEGELKWVEDRILSAIEKIRD